MTGNSGDKLYIRADDVCFTLPRFSFSLLARLLARIVSKQRRSWHFYLRTSPLRGRSAKEYLAREELVLRNEQRTCSWIMRRFQFHLYSRGIYSFRRAMYVCVFARYRFRRARDISDTRPLWETLYNPDAVSAILEKRFRNNSSESPHVNYQPSDNSVLLRARCLKNSRDSAAAFVISAITDVHFVKRYRNNARRVNLATPSTSSHSATISSRLIAPLRFRGSDDECARTENCSELFRLR